MKNINHILFPTDFSDNAQNALPYALELACHFGAELTLFHAIEEPYDFSAVVEEYKGKLTKKVEELLREQIEEISKNPRYEKLTVHYAIRIGKVVRAILEETEKDEIDFIVMSTQGSHALKKILFGTYTSEVILFSDVPVLTIPYEAKYEGFDHITFATDYREKDVDALSLVTFISERFNSALTVVHVEEEEHFDALVHFKGFRQQIMDEIPLSHIKYELLIGEDFYEGIQSFTDKVNSALLVMTRNDKKFIRKLINRAHSTKLTFYSKIPLLVIM